MITHRSCLDSFAARVHKLSTFESVGRHSPCTSCVYPKPLPPENPCYIETTMSIGDKELRVGNMLHPNLSITLKDQIGADACSREQVISGLGKRYLAERPDEDETLTERSPSTQATQGSAW